MKGKGKNMTLTSKGPLRKARALRKHVIVGTPSPQHIFIQTRLATMLLNNIIIWNHSCIFSLLLFKIRHFILIFAAALRYADFNFLSLQDLSAFFPRAVGIPDAETLNCTWL